MMLTSCNRRASSFPLPRRSLSLKSTTLRALARKQVCQRHRIERRARAADHLSYPVFFDTRLRLIGLQDHRKPALSILNIQNEPASATLTSERANAIALSGERELLTQRAAIAEFCYKESDNYVTNLNITRNLHERAGKRDRPEWRARALNYSNNACEQL